MTAWLRHLKYLAVGGAMACAFVGAVTALVRFPVVVYAAIAVALAYGLGWAYYYHRSGQ